VNGPRRRRMIRGTIARIGDLTMRYGRLSQLATLECTSSRRSTVMCALPRATAVTTEYQRDSSSKRAFSGGRRPTDDDSRRRPYRRAGPRGGNRRRYEPLSNRRTPGVVGWSLSSPGRKCWQASLDADASRQPLAQDDARSGGVGGGPHAEHVPSHTVSPSQESARTQESHSRRRRLHAHRCVSHPERGDDVPGTRAPTTWNGATKVRSLGVSFGASNSSVCPWRSSLLRDMHSVSF
jgi:hypothetical protein